MTYLITIDGKPYGQSRPRFNRWTGAAYNASKSREYRKLVQFKARGIIEKPINDAVSVEIWAVFQVPKSWSIIKQARAYAGAVSPTKKPDIDNIAKAILDGLNGIAFRDDAQVVRLAVNKLYGEKNCVKIKIMGGKDAL